MFYFLLFLISIFFIGWYIVAYSFYDSQVDEQKVFVTDGCTLFFDGKLHECCVEHDRAYWQGGSSTQRKSVDEKFKECVYKTSNNKMLSYGMYVAVRVFAIPYINTPWRWGFGWEFGRGYL